MGLNPNVTAVMPYHFLKGFTSFILLIVPSSLQAEGSHSFRWLDSPSRVPGGRDQVESLFLNFLRRRRY